MVIFPGAAGRKGREMDGVPMLIWEPVNSTDTLNWSRARVFGGWLVRAWMPGEGFSSPVFIPDSSHEWGQIAGAEEDPSRESMVVLG